jgi:hypothetical protein
MHKYAAKTHAFEDELKATLSSGALKNLHADMAQLGKKAWFVWEAAHTAEVAAFVRASVAQRAKRRAWQPPDMKGRLVLASIRHVLYARLMLRLVSHPSLQPGGSYRDTAADAGEAYWELLCEDVPCWPLDGESPFDE